MIAVSLELKACNFLGKKYLQSSNSNLDLWINRQRTVEPW
jgi:hypothetical protein